MHNDKQNFKTTKLACYSAYFTMSTIFCVPPLLFVTFNRMYGVSYTLLGTLVLINFFTQLLIDILFTFAPGKFNVARTVRNMPLVTSVGLFIYALIPLIFPSLAYLGLVIGTVIFSVSAGLSEVFLSPTIAAIPSDNPQRDMSTLHSLYAFGVVTMVLVSTLFLKLFGTDRWMYLLMLLSLLPIIPAVLFRLAPMPDVSASHATESKRESKRRRIGLFLCILCIFFGSCAENVMLNWISGYMESALHIDKSLGDILGAMMFAVLLGVARISYARFGKKIVPILIFGMSGSVICYLVAGLSGGVVPAFIACIATGLCTSMLWPGALIMMEENVPGAGVTAFAAMAASGDLGAAIAPQLMGVVVDSVSASDAALSLSTQLSMTAEEIGMKAGMLVTAIFPMLGVITLLFTVRWIRSGKDKTLTL